MSVTIPTDRSLQAPEAAISIPRVQTCGRNVVTVVTVVLEPRPGARLLLSLVGMADPIIPDHFTYFFRRGQTPFQSICDLDEAEAEALLNQDTLWRADGTYLAHRKRHEQLLRDLFMAKGGRPRRAHPIYMV